MPKTTPNSSDVTAYIEQEVPENRRKYAFYLLDLFQKISGLPPVKWGNSIIGFGRYHYKYESGHEGNAPLLAFSPRKQHQVLYVLTNFENQAQLLEQLGKYKTGKVCLYITRLSNVDLAVLKKIVEQAWQQAQKELL